MKIDEDELTRKIIAAIKLAYNKGVQDERYRYKKKKPKRRSFSRSTKKLVLLLQGLRCRRCRLYTGIYEFDHIDGNKANNLSNNCQALCPTCHRIKTKRMKLYFKS